MTNKVSMTRTQADLRRSGRTRRLRPSSNASSPTETANQISFAVSSVSAPRGTIRTAKAGRYLNWMPVFSAIQRFGVPRAVRGGPVDRQVGHLVGHLVGKQQSERDGGNRDEERRSDSRRQLPRRLSRDQRE